ncbi:MAG: alpha/beta fold hydrolase [Pseudomonadota bacterium]
MKRLGGILIGIVVAVAVILAGGWLALRRPDIPWPTLQAKYANAASRYADLPGGLRVHYRDQGRRDGPTLVMVHGFAASLHTWEPWVQRLGADYRIVTLDLPGFGLTSAPEGYRVTRRAYPEVVDQLTRGLGIERFVLVGNSMGGGVAWSYALAHPDRLEGLVLVDSAGWPRDRADGRDGPLVFKVLASPAGRLLLRDLDSSAMTRAGLRDAFEPTPDMVDEAMLARYVEMARAPGHRDIIMGLMSGHDPRDDASKARLAKIAVPTLVMHGDTDRLIPVADAGRFGEAIPGAKVIIYPRIGHIPMEQIPDRSAADLDAWLKAAVWPVRP